MELVEKLERFVKTTCKGRDDTHGFKHMKKVAENAIKIYEEEYTSQSDASLYRKDILIVAYLHDVCDHKYDRDGTLKNKVKQFLKDELDLTSGLCEWYLDIIDRISYSREVKFGSSKWESELTSYGVEIRNIVSDADKLEAIGKVGIDRCREFILEKYPDLSKDEVNKKILEHAEEKLLLIKDKFIRTNAGKRLAEPLHEEMVKELSTL